MTLSPTCSSLFLDCELGAIFLYLLLYLYPQHLLHLMTHRKCAANIYCTNKKKKKHRTSEVLFDFSSSVSHSAPGDVQSSVRYDLALDPSRLISRAIFDETKNRTLSRRKTLGLGDYCETIKLLLPVRTLGSGKGGGRRSPRIISGISAACRVRWKGWGEWDLREEG